jgi:hypothetical protein
LFPEAQLETRAEAAFSAFGCGAPGVARVVVVGVRALVVGRVVGADVSEVLQPVAVTPRIMATATARMDRVRVGITLPF